MRSYTIYHQHADRHGRLGVAQVLLVDWRGAPGAVTDNGATGMILRKLNIPFIHDKRFTLLLETAFRTLFSFS